MILILVTIGNAICLPLCIITDETKRFIESLGSKVDYSIRHVCQQHNDFRAAMIRNKEIFICVTRVAPNGIE